MKNILSEIYHGSYTVLNHRNRKGTPFAKTLDRMNELESEIRKSLPDGLKDAFEQYVQAQADLADMACEEDFISGYQLGIRLMLVGIRRSCVLSVISCLRSSCDCGKRYS